MKIRQTVITDLPALLETFDYGRKALRETNNNVQWKNGYPSAELLQQDIASGTSYVCVVDEKDETDLPLGTIVATIYIQMGENKVFDNVPAEQWVNNDPYVTVQRLCGNGKLKGAGIFCLKWATENFDNIRIYTHESNVFMKKIISKVGFHFCGQALLVDDIPRDIYQFVRTDDTKSAIEGNEAI